MNTVNVMNNRYGVDNDLADFVNDVIYSVFFSDSYPGYFTDDRSAWAAEGAFAEHEHVDKVTGETYVSRDEQAMESLRVMDPTIDTDDVMRRLQAEADSFLQNTARYKAKIADAKVSLMLEETVRGRKMLTWKIDITPAAGYTKKSLISYTISGAMVRKVKEDTGV